ncbi:hypothetical protein ACIQC5_12205 [Paenarthrobacter sp. NPDC092416]|uniref:hypothetical protein n=1 Tax=Paenarthrobacter sp. NPDC092416 TaxID=3364386 RepID=UPI003818FE7B
MQDELNTIEIRVSTRRALEEELEFAVTRLQHVASHARTRGILVPRQDFGRFTASLSELVPYGTTLERRA